MKKTKKRIPTYTKKIYPLMLFIATLFMGIGYATINSITLDVTGTAMAPEQEIFISDVVYESNVSANVEESKIINFSGTMLNSKIVLSNSDPNSSITYTITIHNNTEAPQSFSGVKYDTAFYDNPNIVYELNGLAIGDTVEANSSVTFTITFHYLDSALASNNILNSYLNFEFKQKFSIQYVNISNNDITTNNYPTYILEGETLNFNMVGKITKLNITVGEKKLVLDTDYTFNNNTLNIPNVTGNVVIEAESSIAPIQGDDGHYFEGSTAPGNNGEILHDGWTGDVYTLTFGVNNEIGTTKTYTYKVKVVNNTEHVWTNIDSSDVIVDAGGGWFGKALQVFSSSVSPTTLDPGETLEITFTVEYRTNLDCAASGQTIVKFNANGEEKQLELNISFSVL